MPNAQTAMCDSLPNYKIAQCSKLQSSISALTQVMPWADTVCHESAGSGGACALFWGARSFFGLGASCLRQTVQIEPKKNCVLGYPGLDNFFYSFGRIVCGIVAARVRRKNDHLRRDGPNGCECPVVHELTFPRTHPVGR